MIPTVDITLTEVVDGIGYHLLQQELSSCSVGIEYKAQVDDDRKIALSVTHSIEAEDESSLRLLTENVLLLEEKITQA